MLFISMTLLPAMNGAPMGAMDVRKYSFSQRTINVWNNLSTDCVHASSVNMFKNKIDKYLVKAGYIYIYIYHLFARYSN